MTDPIRAALERLVARLDETTDPNGPVPAWSDSFYAARAALSADDPAVPDGREPAAVVEQPSDAELRDIWETGHLPSSEELANDDGEQDLQFLFTSAYYRWLEENPDAREEHENKCIRAVFNAGRRFGHQPAPAAVPAEQWHEDMGPVLWWRFPVEEPPYCGSPLDASWPGYHTHFTPLVIPQSPQGGEVADA